MPDGGTMRGLYVPNHRKTECATAGRTGIADGDAIKRVERQRWLTFSYIFME
jgi:hypothetical protein